jgi:hypothetical protein
MGGFSMLTWAAIIAIILFLLSKVWVWVLLALLVALWWFFFK